MLPDHELQWFERQLQAAAAAHRRLAARGPYTSTRALYRRQRLADFYFRALLLNLPPCRRDQLVELAVSYYKDPSRYA